MSAGSSNTSDDLKPFSALHTLIYCMPAVALSAMGVVVFVHLPKFHTSELGIALSVISLVLLLSRSWDAVTDPVIGFLSDSIQSPFLRRPAWLLIGGSAASLVFYWLCSEDLMRFWGTGFWGFLLLSFLFFLFYTAAVIPYESWVLEVLPSEKERTRVIMLREGATIFGTLVAGALPVALSAQFDSQTEVFQILGFSLSMFFFLSVLLCTLVVPRPLTVGTKELPRGAFLSSKAALSLPVFRILLFAFCLTTIAAQIPGALILFFVEDVLLVSEPSKFVLQYFIGAAIGFPIWLVVARRYNKADLWIVGILINTIFFCGVLFVSSETVWIYSICVVGSGLGLGGVLAIPTAISADVIEYDVSTSGERREGSFVGLWSIVRKVAGALGVSGVLALLAYLGYEPESTQVVTSELQWSIRLLYCLLPSVINLSAIFVIFSLKNELKKIQLENRE